MEFFKSILSSNEEIKKGIVTIIYEDKETKVSWYPDTPFEDTKLALNCACDALCDSEFELLDFQAKIIQIEGLSELKDGSIYFLRKKPQESNSKELKTGNILVDGKRKLLVLIEPLMHLEAQVAVKFMLIGSNLLKHTKNGFPHIRLFQISQDLRRILWYTKSKPLTDSQITFSLIEDIVVGQHSDNFMRYPLPMLEDFSFSIYFKNKNDAIETLDITCKDSREFDLWLIGVKALVAHAKGKIVCKNDLLDHSKSYCEQIKKGNISNCSKYLIYSDEKESGSKSLEKFIISRNMTMKDMSLLIQRLIKKIKDFKLDIKELTDEEKLEENIGKDNDYEEVFADEAIADDTETQKNKMCNLIIECEDVMGRVIHEFLWYNREHRLNSKFLIDEDDYEEFAKTLAELEIHGNTFTTGKNEEYYSSKINMDFFLKELDIKLWKLEIDIENVGDIINRFKFPQQKGFFNKVKEYINSFNKII